MKNQCSIWSEIWIYLRDHNCNSLGDTESQEWINWRYYKILAETVKPFVRESSEIKKYFYSLYLEDGWKIKLRILGGDPQKIKIKKYSNCPFITKIVIPPKNGDSCVIGNYDINGDVGNRFCKEVKSSEINEEALNAFIDYWWNASNYFLSILGTDGAFPEWADVSFAPHLFFNLIGTSVPVSEFELTKIVKQLRKKGIDEREIEEISKKYKYVREARSYYSQIRENKFTIELDGRGLDLSRR
jgi:hypothetical protein